MKNMEDIALPEQLRYSQDHEWVGGEGDLVRIGITDYAQDQLGDIVFVDLPAVGAGFAKGAVFATVESVKSVSDCFMPVGGEVVAVNEALGENPGLINTAPYAEGWMALVRPSDPGDVNALWTADRYRAHLTGGA